MASSEKTFEYTPNCTIFHSIYRMLTGIENEMKKKRDTKKTIHTKMAYSLYVRELKKKKVK